MSRFNLLCTPRLFSQLHYRHQVTFQLAELWGYHIMCRNPFKRDYCWISDEAYSWLILLFVNEVSIRSLQFWECYHTGTPAEVPGNIGSAAGNTHTRHTSSLSNSGFKHMLLLLRASHTGWNCPHLWLWILNFWHDVLRWIGDSFSSLHSSIVYPPRDTEWNKENENSLTWQYCWDIKLAAKSILL